jgi:tol-pal system protein YbgF
MKKIITIVAVAAIAALAATPVGAQNREHLQMAADVRMLQENQQQLAVSISQLADAIKSLNARLDDVTNATRKGFADQKVDLDQMTRDVSALRNSYNDTFVKVGTFGEELEAIRKSLTSLGQVSAASAGPVDPTLAAADPAAVPPPAPSTLGLSPGRMYDEAFADYGAGQFVVAIAGFQQFISQFPTSAKADDAQFFIGEAQFQQRKYADAITAYNAVIQNYPTGDQVPLAIYKRGMAQLALGQNDAARQSFELVVQKYPDSDGGRLAKPQLEKLKAPAPAR